TYFQYNGRHYFHDNVKCGSDCVNASNQFCNPGTTGCHSPLGYACQADQSHTCYCEGGSDVQNDNMTWLGLFGPGPMPGPTVAITKPEIGQALMPGCVVNANGVPDNGVTEAE